MVCFAQLGSTAIGVKTSEGVVLAVEKRITSPLLVRLVAAQRLLFCLIALPIQCKGSGCVAECAEHHGTGQGFTT